MSVKKIVRIDKRAFRELQKLPLPARAKIKSSIKLLGRDGDLVEPYAKKLDKELFEIRVKYKGEFRALYSYLKDGSIVILSSFYKKTQHTPEKELTKAKKRLKEQR